MKDIIDLYKDKARIEFVIHNAEKVEVSAEKYEKEKKKICDKIRKYMQNPGLAKPCISTIKDVYSEVAEDMRRSAADPIYLRCKNCQLWHEYHNNATEDLDLCGKLKALDTCFFTEGDYTEEEQERLLAELKDEKKYCNKHEPIGPQEFVTQEMLLEVNEIDEWERKQLEKLDY